MPDRDQPRWARRVLRVMRGLMYAFTGLTCGFAMTLTPESVEGALGMAATYGWGSVGLGSSLACLAGVVLGRYRLELGFVWFAAAAMSVYVVAVWWLVLRETTPTGAAFLTVGVLALAYRGFELQAYASKLRRLHYRRP